MMCSCLPGFVGEADIGCHKGKNPLELQGYSGVLWSSLFKYALLLSLLLSLQQQFLYKVLKQIYILDYKPIYSDAPLEQLHIYIFWLHSITLNCCTQTLSNHIHWKNKMLILISIHRTPAWSGLYVAWSMPGYGSLSWRKLCQSLSG